MSNPFDGDDAGDEKSGSLKRLLKMRKWMAAVCVPLLLFHFGWLDVESLVGIVKGVAIPQHVVVDFLFGSALFQGVVFALALFQFFLAYNLSLRARSEPAGLRLKELDAEIASIDKQIANHQANYVRNAPVDIVETLTAARGRLELTREVAVKKMLLLAWPEIAQDFLRLAPTILLWTGSVGLHANDLLTRSHAAALAS